MNEGAREANEAAQLYREDVWKAQVLKRLERIIELLERLPQKPASP